MNEQTLEDGPSNETEGRRDSLTKHLRSFSNPERSKLAKYKFKLPRSTFWQIFEAGVDEDDLFKIQGQKEKVQESQQPKPKQKSGIRGFTLYLLKVAIKMDKGEFENFQQAGS